MTEAELKSLVEDYLEIQEAQGKLMFLRLNAGSFLLVNNDGTMRCIKGCKKGTADLEIIKKGRAIFIELKGEHGAPSKVQREFGNLAKYHGAEYHVVHTFEELQQVIECAR